MSFLTGQALRGREFGAFYPYPLKKSILEGKILLAIAFD
jgi:hypothetical protein